VILDPLRIDVARLLSALGMTAEKVGVKWWAQCPLHASKKPHWNMRDTPGRERHGVHGCYSCGYSGDAINLAKDVLGYATRAVAEQWVADHAVLADRIPPSVELEILASTQRGLQLPDGVRCTSLADWFGPAREYATRPDRGLTAEQVDRWGLGYAVDGRQRGRIVFPTRDLRGRLLSFTGRSFIGSDPKYLTASKGEGRQDGAVFGEQHWPAQRGRLHVTEGEINALAVERATGGAVAALSGSHLAVEQVLKIGTFNEIVICTDPDPAGAKAASQLVGALARHARVRRATLPEGTDAAVLERSDLAARLEQAT